MNENEVIIVDGISAQVYDKLVEESVKYAIISLPFTVDRMNITDEKRRAFNIAKGKIAEKLFEHFCDSNSISVDFKSCETPFWDVDKKDFLYDNKEWDIKNNFIYHQQVELQNYNYTDLPALIPNRFSTGDQWSKRENIYFKHTDGSGFVFTFLKGSDLNNGNRGQSFLEINISDKQTKYLRYLYDKYQGHPQTKSPFTKEWFWAELEKLSNKDFFKINFRPNLVITAYANKRHWSKFENTGRFDKKDNLKNHITPHWYIKHSTGSLNFLEGTLWTKITNKTSPISELPSFSSMFQSLNNSMEIARFKS